MKSKFLIVFFFASLMAISYQNCAGPSNDSAELSSEAALPDDEVDEIPPPPEEEIIDNPPSSLPLQFKCQKSGASYDVNLNWTLPNGATINTLRKRVPGEGWSLNNYVQLPLSQTSYRHTGMSEGESLVFNVKYRNDAALNEVQVTTNSTNCK